MNRMTVALFVLLILCVAWLTPVGPTAAEGEVSSDVARAAPTGEAIESLPLLAAGNTAFALALYHELREGQTNLFFSPLSVSMALGMVSAGARGETLAQMKATLHFGLDQDALHPAFNALDRLLESRQYPPEGTGEGFTLNLVNSIWGQVGHEFLPQFLGVLSEFYGAGVRLADFAADPEGARRAINAWVEEATHDRIRELIQRGQIDESTRLTLVNAIYFNAPWAFPFDERDTAVEPFTLLDGTEVEVPLMRQTESHGYTAGDDYQAVELDYNGRELSMVVILPDEGSFGDVEARLSPEFLGEVTGGLSHERLILWLPGFTFEWGEMLNGPLGALGMTDAFDGQRADFSGIDGTRDFFIGLVIHKAYVAVDEAGTEAAAATAVVMVGAGPTPPSYREVRVDRPFLFFIRDKETGSILFIGRVLDPRP